MNIFIMKYIEQDMLKMIKQKQTLTFHLRKNAFKIFIYSGLMGAPP